MHKFHHRCFGLSIQLLWVYRGKKNPVEFMLTSYSDINVWALINPQMNVFQIVYSGGN